MQLLTKYINGNYIVKLYDDGTKIKINNDGFFDARFPDSIDVKITDYCDMDCPMCHEKSSTQGQHASLDLEFIDTLPSGIELALGGGNPLSHPNLVDFLTKLKNKNIIANLTVNENHFLKNISFLQKLLDKKLIYGLGVSLIERNKKTLEFAKNNPSVVFHLIVGIVSLEELRSLYDKNFKILLLGYKKFGRGRTNYSSYVRQNLEELKDNFDDIRGKFKVVSFDNLALRQLNVRDKVSQSEWDKLYMGDDGESTMYIDMVKQEFAICSTSTIRHKLLSDVKKMFSVIKKESKKDVVNVYAVFTKDKEDKTWYNVIFPGVYSACTCGIGLRDSLFMAKDCIKTVYESLGIKEFEDALLFSKEQLKHQYPTSLVKLLTMTFEKEKKPNNVYEVRRRSVFETNSSGTHSISVVYDYEEMVRITDPFEIFKFLTKKLVDDLSKRVVEIRRFLDFYFKSPNVSRETLWKVIDLLQINEQTMTEILGDLDFENDNGRFKNSFEYYSHKTRYCALSEEIGKLYTKLEQKNVLLKSYIKMTGIDKDMAGLYLDSKVPNLLQAFILSFDEKEYLKGDSIYSSHHDDAFDTCPYTLVGLAQSILSGHIHIYQIVDSKIKEDVGYFLKYKSENVSTGKTQFDLLIYVLASCQIYNKHTTKDVYTALKDDESYDEIEPNVYQLILNVYLEETNEQKNSVLERVKQVAKNGSRTNGLCFGLFDGDLFYSSCPECPVLELTDGFHSLIYNKNNYAKIRKEIVKIFKHKRILFSTEY